MRNPVTLFDNAYSSGPQVGLYFIQEAWEACSMFLTLALRLGKLIRLTKFPPPDHYCLRRRICTRDVKRKWHHFYSEPSVENFLSHSCLELHNSPCPEFTTHQSSRSGSSQHIMLRHNVRRQSKIVLSDCKDAAFSSVKHAGEFR